jgi:hypothetical protein
MSEPTNADETQAGEAPRPNRRTKAFDGYSIGLPERIEKALSLPPGVDVLVPSRFQPEHTLMAALETLTSNRRGPDSATSDPSFPRTSGP